MNYEFIRDLHKGDKLYEVGWISVECELLEDPRWDTDELGEFFEFQCRCYSHEFRMMGRTNMVSYGPRLYPTPGGQFYDIYHVDGTITYADAR